MIEGRPPLWLKLCVVVGGCTLVLGLVGASLLLVRGEEDAPVGGAGLAPRLRLEGLAGVRHDALRVTASWHDAETDADVTQAALALAAHPYTFLLPPDSGGRKVRIEVYDDGADPPRLLHAEDVLATREDIVVLRVEGGGTVPVRR